MYSDYTKQQVIDFFNRYGKSIVTSITNTNLFFPAVIGQLTMESKWGTSGLSADHNNFGGIKATGSQYSSGQVSLDTTEYSGGKLLNVKQSFATYADFDAFMKDYVRVLQLPQYINAGVYKAQTPEEQILAIGKGGYSTADPNDYLEKARGRIEAARDQYKFGKISTSVTSPTLVKDIPGSATNWAANILNGALGGAMIGTSPGKPVTATP